MDSKTIEQNLKSLISKKLEQLRSKNHKTLEESADFLDLDYAQYYRLLKGRQLPHLATLIRINQAYGLDMNWWFKDLAKTKPKIAARAVSPANEQELLERIGRLDHKSRKILLKMLRQLTSGRDKEFYSFLISNRPAR
ncbi:helix-turn-helix XRE-family transcriptional regulators [Candidatus Termititenax aidoneus]|uniref:Helix-turn-helix XRE-family transcriptional regulators n=1 Tax=Termititenax aidoneus TaxID=2218524 RepID=A0A388TEC2_TERA1|nr:helix-turn-helix XRE-family transcriptional regulators [Candidatus Termititenax aidoneus]